MPLPSIQSTPAGPSGVRGALKRFLGENAEALPPGYKVDPSLLRQTPTHVSTLSNGLRVASEQMDIDTATVGLWLDAGTRFEPASLNGAAHFLEHLIFKGTGRRTQQQLEREVEDLGAHLNAYTSREQTVYFARSLAADAPQCIDLLADIIQNSRLDAGAVERERDVILREMEDIDGQPEEVLFDYLHNSAFQGTPLARTILGPVESIQSLTRDNLADYVAAHYKPHRMVLVGAGAIDHKQFVDMAEKQFGGMAKAESETTTADSLAAAEPAYFTGSAVCVRNDDQPQAHFAIAFETCGWSHPDAPALMVMQSLLGAYDRNAALSGHSGARLPRALGDVPNCASAQAFNTSYVDTGLFGVYAIAEAPELDDVLHQVQENMTGLAYRIDDAEVERAKQQLKTSMSLQVGDSSAVAEEIGRQLLTYGRRMPVAEAFARIDAVSAESLQRVAGKYLHDRELCLAGMGPIATLPDYNWARRRTYWLRY